MEFCPKNPSFKPHIYPNFGSRESAYRLKPDMGAWPSLASGTGEDPKNHCRTPN